MADILILGINGGLNTVTKSIVPELNPGICHDASAVLLHRGKVVAGFEEERLTRIKHCNHFPARAIRACLESYDVTPHDVDFFTFSMNEKILDANVQELSGGRVQSGRAFMQHIMHEHTGILINKSKMKFYDHHFCHAVSSYFQSGFSESLVATFDGAGDGISGSIYDFRDNKFELLRKFPIEDSLGYFYLTITRQLGFDLFDEYKVMGLAPYGNPEVFKDIFSRCYSLKPDGDFKIHEKELAHLGRVVLGRKKGESITQHHMDIAASLQLALESILEHVLRYYQKKTVHDNLCLAGGVALNGTFTGNLAYKNVFKSIFVHPASGDNGLSLGGALACHYELRPEAKRSVLVDLYWGTPSTKVSVHEEELSMWSDFVQFESVDDPSEVAAELLSNDHVIGWFQGRSEFGPRALGNRSILADPRPAHNKARVNAIIKMREGFRPFAPSILEEFVEEFFDLPNPTFKSTPFMTFVWKVKEKYRNSLRAVTHVDGSARLQTVAKEVNPNYWNLINNFRKRTGTPILLNTSFNNNVEPIVDTPSEAIACFLTNQLDYLFIDNYLVVKRPVGQSIESDLKVVLLDHIAPGITGTKDVVLWDTYFKKRHEVSFGLLELFKTSSNGIPLKKLSESDRTEVMQLWQKRLIKILPLHASMTATE